MNFNSEEINHLIRVRRSVFPKDYSGETVPDRVIEQMLENANWAPTHKLTEPWRFVVFAGEGRKALAAFQSECYKQVTAAKGTFQEDRYLSLQTKPMESSHIIAVGMNEMSPNVFLNGKSWVQYFVQYKTCISPQPHMALGVI